MIRSRFSLIFGILFPRTGIYKSKDCVILVKDQIVNSFGENRKDRHQGAASENRLTDG